MSLLKSSTSEASAVLASANAVAMNEVRILKRSAGNQERRHQFPLKFEARLKFNHPVVLAFSRRRILLSLRHTILHSEFNLMPYS